MQKLIAITFGVNLDLISGGPKWANTAGFTLQAKVASSDVEALARLTNNQRNAMLRTVLAERFHLRSHKTTRIVPVYELVVADGGPKMVKSQPTMDAGSQGRAIAGNLQFFGNRIVAKGMPVRSLAGVLSAVAGRKVVDKTGLTGNYDFKLNWTPEEELMKESSSDEHAYPSIFTALKEQLGLKLKPARGPVDALVIDHIEMPAAN